MEKNVYQELLDAWIAITRGLGDEWPLVKEAFQEQLTAAFEKAEALRAQITEGELLDCVGGQLCSIIYLFFFCADQNTLASVDNNMLMILWPYL